MEPTNQADKKNAWLIPGSIIVAGILIAGAVYFANTPHGTTTATIPGTTPNSNGTVTVDSSKISTANEPFIGQQNAPLTIAYWYDYQCPYCKQNEATLMPQLITDYVNTGKAKVVFKDFAFLGADSQTLGLASRAVWEVAPDKFYAWHKEVFAEQGEENSGWATPAKILSISTSVLGAADAAKVQTLMTTNATEYQKDMDADKAEGAALGVNGTPSFIIGNQLVVGADSYSSIQSIVDSQLK